MDHSQEIDLCAAVAQEIFPVRVLQELGSCLFRNPQQLVNSLAVHLQVMIVVLPSAADWRLSVDKPIFQQNRSDFFFEASKQGSEAMVEC